MGSDGGTGQESRPKAQKLLDTFLDLGNEEFPKYVFNSKPDPLLPTAEQVGAFGALLRRRAYSEFVHSQRVKKEGRRPKKGSGKTRAKNSTSPRIHIAVLPEELAILEWLLPDGDFEGPCRARICFGKGKMEHFLQSTKWISDNEDITFPYNENNSALRRFCLLAAKEADRLGECLRRTGPGAVETFKVCFKTAYRGIMEIPKELAAEMPHVVPPTIPATPTSAPTGSAGSARSDTARTPVCG